MLITMAGVRGSGKTCYLYATYNAMMDGINSLFFNPTDHFEMLDLQDKWDSMIENKEFPPGTSESKEYSFTAILAGKVLNQFTWYDYKGALLQENGSSEYREFESRCRNSDCVVFAIPADLLKAMLNNETKYLNGEVKVVKDFRIYQNCIMKLRDEKRTLPIVINVTKGDLLSGEEMKKAVEEIIYPQFPTLFGTEGGDALICRTSIQKTLPDGSRDFTPRNVHHPIIFPFYLKLKKLGTTSDLILLREMLKGSLYYNNGKQAW